MPYVPVVIKEIKKRKKLIRLIKMKFSLQKFNKDK